MSPTFLVLAVISLFAAAAWLAVWARRDTWGRSASVGLFLIGIPAIAAAGIQSLGHHRPMSLAWELPAGEHRVLSAKMVQDEAIYLYLDAGRSEPWPLTLPWDNATANRIGKLQDEAGEGAMGQFLLRYEPSLDLNAQQFHPIPQPQLLPPKPRQQQGQRFEQDA
jgi:hypothetical protein